MRRRGQALTRGESHCAALCAGIETRKGLDAVSGGCSRPLPGPIIRGRSPALSQCDRIRSHPQHHPSLRLRTPRRELPLARKPGTLLRKGDHAARRRTPRRKPHGNPDEKLMMRRAALSRLVVSFVTLLCCCTKSHDVDVPGGGASEADAGASAPPGGGNPLCARLAAIQCAGEQRCCSDSTRSVERCESDRTQSCAQTAYLDQIARSPLSGFDASALERAFIELEQRTMRCDPTIADWVLSDTGLRGAFNGTLGSGSNCNPAGGVTGDPGTVAASLSACRRADELACLPLSLLGNWSCAPRQPIGGSCLTDVNCDDNAACNNFSEPALGSCVARLPLGAACTAPTACASLNCAGEVCAEPDAAGVYCRP